MTSSFQTLTAAEQYCNSFISPPHAPKNRTLERMKNLMASLGNPQENLSVVHVGGSVGKGSTAYMTATLLESAGLSVGLHIKPHLQSITERCIINRKVMPDADFVSYVNNIRPHVEKLREKPTYFELLVAIALWYFNDRHVDVAVVEVGRGGRVDATNICPSTLFILTNVMRLHTDILGTTLFEIATEKMGVVKNSTTVVTGVSQKSVLAHIKTLCRQTNSTLRILGHDFFVDAAPQLPYEKNNPARLCTYTDLHTALPDIPMPLFGDFQLKNAALAITAAKLLTTLSDTQIRTAFQSMKFPGRMEILPYRTNTLVMDSAHDATKIGKLVATLKHLFPHTRMQVVLPAQRFSGTEAYIQVFRPMVSAFVLITYPERKPSPQDVAAFTKSVKNAGCSCPVTSINIDAFASYYSNAKRNTVFLVTGSMTLIGAVRKNLGMPFQLQ